MEYRQWLPPSDLTPWVECAWVLRGVIAAEGQVILPDGRLELVFHFGGQPLSRGGKQPDTLIAGRMVEALELRPNGTMNTLGVRLRPGSVHCLIPCHLVSGIEGMEAVLGGCAKQAWEHIGDAGSDNGRIAIVWNHVRSWLRRSGIEADPAIVRSVALIEAAKGQGHMEQFLPTGMSLRQWQRRFVQTTGFTPKAFARISRFQHLVSLYESGQMGRWADLALQTGFYDQAHLTNSFREFSGLSPEAFFRTGLGMAEFYRDAFFQDGGQRSA